MLLILILSTLFITSMAQRPTYAGSSPKGYPEVASRFKDENDDSSITLTNRVGEDDSQPKRNLPTDARGDADLVTRIQDWPRENQPFWYLNADHIEKQRHPDGSIVRSNSEKNNRQQGQIRPLINTIPNSDSRPKVPVRTTNRNNNDGIQFQQRFGEPVATETRTIKPISQRGSFAGSGRI